MLTSILGLALKHHIGIYSAHTNFDQVQDGTADVLAQILQLQECTPIVPTQLGLGYGRVGMLSYPRSLPELLILIKSQLNSPHLIVSPFDQLEVPISRVAVLGGAGAGYIDAVVKTNAQAYLTSDCKFHQFQTSRDRHSAVNRCWSLRYRTPCLRSLSPKISVIELGFCAIKSKR